MHSSMSPGFNLSDALSTINSLRRRSGARASIRSFLSSSSAKHKEKSSDYRPYSVYDQTMFPLIFRDPEAFQRLLEIILDTPGGRRIISRLARTCRAISEPALAILWRDLDSLIPLLALFPSDMLRKARKPGLGLTRPPKEDDWAKVLRYGEKVQRITYDESLSNVASSIFPILEEYRPVTYILPSLKQVTCKVESAAGMDRCKLFLNPQLEGLILEIGHRYTQLEAFLADVASKLKLKHLSISNPNPLPASFHAILQSQDALERLNLNAPGALSPTVGGWVGSLPKLRDLELDLTGRSAVAVEGFFDELHDSVPDSPASTDSGVFSADEVDFSELRKSAIRITSEPEGYFASLRSLNLTGEVSNIATFLKHIHSPITQLNLVIDDPPDRQGWSSLSSLLSTRFRNSLSILRIAGSTAFTEQRVVSRVDAGRRLALKQLGSLPRLYRLEVDMPESVLVNEEDISHLASICPNLEELKLSPLARFPLSGGPPLLQLESLAPLTTSCRRLHTLSIVVNARPGSPAVLASREVSSDSLQRLHVGHSWINDSLHASILLSHLCPRLEMLKWFHEKNRPGFVEVHARNWEKVSDTLPHLQNVRLLERSFEIPSLLLEPQRRETAEKAIDATPTFLEKAVLVRPMTTTALVQATPLMASWGVQAVPSFASVSINAVPVLVDRHVHTVIALADASVDARPETLDACIDAQPTAPSVPRHSPFQHLTVAKVILMESMARVLSLPWKALILPITLSSYILRLLRGIPSPWRKVNDEQSGENNVAMQRLSSQTASGETALTGTEIIVRP